MNFPSLVAELSGQGQPRSISIFVLRLAGFAIDNLQVSYPVADVLAASSQLQSVMPTKLPASMIKVSMIKLNLRHLFIFITNPHLLTIGTDQFSTRSSLADVNNGCQPSLFVQDLLNFYLILAKKKSKLVKSSLLILYKIMIQLFLSEKLFSPEKPSAIVNVFCLSTPQ